MVYADHVLWGELGRFEAWVDREKQQLMRSVSVQHSEVAFQIHAGNDLSAA